MAKTWDAKRVRALRRRLALSQRAFGDLISVSGGAVSRWENGHRTAHGKSLDQLEAQLQKSRQEVGDFIRERFQRDPSGVVSMTLVSQLYREWCRARSQRPLPYGELWAAVERDHGVQRHLDGSLQGLALPQPSYGINLSQTPEPPPLGPGPDYAPVGGKLAAVPHPPSEDEAKLQARLHAQLRTKVAGLVAALAHAGNQYAELMRAASEYEVLLQGPTSKLDIVKLWSVGGSLHELLGAYREQSDGTLAPPLEPQMIAALASVVRDHGAFVLGFEEGRDLVDRADRFTLQPELIDEVAEPGAELLDELATNGELIEETSTPPSATLCM